LYKLFSAEDPLKGDRSMERRFEIRLEELLNDAVVSEETLRTTMAELDVFLEPFLESMGTAGQRSNMKQYVNGLLSDLDGKDIESIAYLHDCDRQMLQKFIGQAEWDHKPPVTELVRQVGTELGQTDAVLVFDPSAFPKKGTESVGVQRQWCGRLGKVDNCQVGIYLGYVSRMEHALVDVRLYLSKQWAQSRRRREKAGVPDEIRFRTRHELALEMLDEDGSSLPHAWISGDDEMGRSSWFRGELRSRGETYLLAVPSNTLVRDLTAPDPAYGGRGRHPQAPFIRVDRWCAALPGDAWQTIDVRDGEKGPIVVQAVWMLVQARSESQPSDVAEILVVFRERQGDGTWKHDYLLSNAELVTPLAEFARVFKSQHRIEECLQRAKGEAGLDHYQVRTWKGWHHHQTLSLIATWFLTRQTRRGKNTNPRADGSTDTRHDCRAAQPSAESLWPRTNSPHGEPASEAKRGGEALPLAPTQPLATSTV
jgi:SRSO17 transposase